MTDRELLEWTAKAAGIDAWFSRMADGGGGVIEPCHYAVDGETAEWNPLTVPSRVIMYPKGAILSSVPERF